jgi:nucleotide-binding universal stress UspA family protein
VQAAEAQEKALVTLPDDVVVEASVVSGRDWEETLDSLPWEEGEVLVVGSSRLGPVARVFLGSNSTKIIRSSPVPVVVIPRGADVHLEDTGSIPHVESSGRRERPEF